jgi:hypothetical protein
MIAFLYPNHDYTAADLSTKVQAMAAARGFKVFSAPRNFNLTAYRNEDVSRKLSLCKLALYAAHDVHQLDDVSRQELGLLQKAGTAVYFIIPEPMVQDVRAAGFSDHIFPYRPHNASELVGIVKKIMDEKTAPVPAKPPVRSGPGAAEVGGFLLLVGLLALLIAAFASDEK